MSPKKKNVPDALPEISKPKKTKMDVIVDALSEGDVDEDEDANFDDPKVKKRIADGQGNEVLEAYMKENDLDDSF